MFITLTNASPLYSGEPISLNGNFIATYWRGKAVRGVNEETGEVTGFFMSGLYRQDCKYETTLDKYLLEKGIQTRDFFYPLDLQPCYKMPTSDRFFTSHKLYKTGISLPSSYNLNIQQQDYIIDNIKNYFK